MKTKELSHAYLIERLTYEPETGFFRWKTNRNSKLIGAIAGSLKKGGYIYINLDGTRHLAHRLAWLYVTGRHPEMTIDHINGTRTDNRWANLREASQPQQGWNMRLHHSSSGVKNVYWHKKSGKWRARIRMHGQEKCLGYFENLSDAETVVREARDFFHKEFARHA